MIDLAKRRRVMTRSRQLGHCICDPRKPCPCDVFTEQGLCPCAGERPDPVPAEAVRLTELVKNAGCASKIAPADLEAVLARLPEVQYPRVLCGMPAGDDAGVYQLDGECLVQTVDVMTPCVDDPRTFGRICAVNCLSDIYAMGAAPHTALSILAFPSETLAGQIMYEMMAGAMDAFTEAGVALVGGHSVKDEQIMLGFAITGTVDPARVTARDAAQPGDALVLTKPLGAGVLAFARQINRGNDAGQRQAEASMATLNRAASQAMVRFGAHACTDVTGFGLFGHLAGMVRHARVTAQIDAGALPAFDGALQLLADNVIPGAIERNLEYVGGDLTADDAVDPARLHLGFDAQTSGGLLISVAESNVDALLAALADAGAPGSAPGSAPASVIGRITEASEGKIHVTTSGTPVPPAHEISTPTAAVQTPPAETPARAFGMLMRTTSAGGAVDERTKLLINIALVTLQRCGPCLKSHLAKARRLGVSQAEIDEAVWCAIAMGGACVKVFYDELQTTAGDGKACC